MQDGNANPKVSQSMLGSDGGDDPRGSLRGCASVEFDGTLNRSREFGMGVRHQRHGHYYNLVLGLTTGHYSTDRDLGRNKEWRVIVSQRWLRSRKCLFLVTS